MFLYLFLVLQLFYDIIGKKFVSQKTTIPIRHRQFKSHNPFELYWRHFLLCGNLHGNHPSVVMSDSNRPKSHAVCKTRSWKTRCTLESKSLEPFVIQATYGLQMPGLSRRRTDFRHLSRLQYLAHFRNLYWRLGNFNTNQSLIL